MIKEAEKLSVTGLHLFTANFKTLTSNYIHIK